MGLITIRRLQSKFYRDSKISDFHDPAKLLRDGVPGEDVKDAGQVTPTDDLEISKIRLPQLVRCSRLILKPVKTGRITRRSLQEPLSTGFRHEVTSGIRERHRPFAQERPVDGFPSLPRFKAVNYSETGGMQMVLLGRIELPASSLPKQGKAFAKVRNTQGLSADPAGDLPTTHAIPKL